jgi:hypothetical protein
VLYFASIAAALVYRDQRITKSDDDVLRTGFDLMLHRPWLAAAIRSLFQTALAKIDRSPD